MCTCHGRHLHMIQITVQWPLVVGGHHSRVGGRNDGKFLVVQLEVGRFDGARRPNLVVASLDGIADFSIAGLFVAVAVLGGLGGVQGVFGSGEAVAGGM